MLAEFVDILSHKVTSKAIARKAVKFGNVDCGIVHRQLVPSREILPADLADQGFEKV